MKDLFKGAYQGLPVLITGHTGFKGSWLALWLQELGADVVGYALPPPSEPNHYDLLDLDMISILGDIRDRAKLEEVIRRYRPEIVFHLAAQSLVRRSYQNPLDTFETNVLGAVNLYEVCRSLAGVKAVVTITTDKVYQNNEWVWGYRENDRLGGYDPYSASKACVELVSAAYRTSFFHPNPSGAGDAPLLATARAGNVIGGGDWAEDRLIPDLMRAVYAHQKAVLRHPDAVRPWQHVLDPLAGYLTLGQRLLEGQRAFASCWNFGPDHRDFRPVEGVVKDMQRHWNKIAYEVTPVRNTSFHETNRITLDSAKASTLLHWRPVWGYEKAVGMTVAWYRAWHEEQRVLSSAQLREYASDLCQAAATP